MWAEDTQCVLQPAMETALSKSLEGEKGMDYEEGNVAMAERSEDEVGRSMEGVWG